MKTFEQRVSYVVFEPSFRGALASVGIDIGTKEYFRRAICIEGRANIQRYAQAAEGPRILPIKLDTQPDPDLQDH